MPAVRVLEYLDARGRSPYATWFDNLGASAAAKVAAAVYRFESGNLSNVKGVGEGVFERREESTSALAIASTSGRMGKVW
jgi:putative component of toxin-antitoxin plasmid stabilization module